MPRFRSSQLRIRIILSVIIPILVMFAVFLGYEYRILKQLMADETQKSAEHIGELIRATLRHTMNNHDSQTMLELIQNSSGVDYIQRIQVIDDKFKVWADSYDENTNAIIPEQVIQCSECHQYKERPSSITFPANGQAAVLRVAMPIENETSCRACHTNNAQHVGVILLDMDISEQITVTNQFITISAVSGLILLGLVLFLAYSQTERLITQRILAFEKPIQKFADGDFSARLPVSDHKDELDNIAQSFNEMIIRIEEYVEKEMKHQIMVQKVIVIERERIARELHDNLPQLLAYLSTKIGAITLLLQNDKKPEAMENLNQLENASRDMLTDVRETIIGLRASRLVANGLDAAIQSYIQQFKEICKASVTFTISPAFEEVELAPELEIQALRIVQEALTNARRHARARQIEINLTVLNKKDLQIVITDNGKGFDTNMVATQKLSHFGLQNMQERAHSQGGSIVVESAPDRGTTVTVSLPLNRI